MELSENTAENILKKYCADIEHARQVEEYSKKLFDALQFAGIINFKGREREYLCNASLLHDIGYYIEKKSHHKHSRDLIIENGVLGFDEDEVKIIALIARYHRGSDPDESKHKIYAELTEEQKKMVCQLASILRIADGMDKPHKNLILRMEVKETESSIDIYIKTVGFKPKLKMAEEKSALFSSVFKKNVQFLFM